LRWRRHERGWTQEQLAEAAGLDRSYVAGVEAGARNVSLDAIVKLAYGLGVAPGDLFEWAADTDAPSAD
jgi:transcriptional regulator with XRE-family HTH domain